MNKQERKPFLPIFIATMTVIILLSLVVFSAFFLTGKGKLFDPKKKKNAEQEENERETQDLLLTGIDQDSDILKAGKEKPKHEEKKVVKDYSNSEVRFFFEKKGLEVIDNRSQGGRLWVIGEKSDIRDTVNMAISMFGISGKYMSGKETKFRKRFINRVLAR